MPNIKSAKKRVLVNETKALRNKMEKSALKTSLKKFDAAVAEGKPFQTIFDGQVYEYDGYVIPKGAPHLEAALKYLTFATTTQALADQAKYISYGPARKSSGPLVGLFEDGKTEMGPYMPTAAENLTNALPSSYEFWVDHDTELNERFNAWLAG